jgi:hypothetical protein
VHFSAAHDIVVTDMRAELDGRRCIMPNRAWLRFTDDSPTNAAEFTVSELSGSIRRTVEDAFGNVRVRGEISGYRGPHSSGHAYFSLKDDRARIEAVIWKGVFPGSSTARKKGWR